MPNIIKNDRLYDATVRHEILEYLSKSGVPLKLEHGLLATEDDLVTIRTYDYIVCPRIRGTRSWIMFFRIENRYYAINFPKHNIRKRDTTNIYALDVVVQEAMYRGTIMEGIYYVDGNTKYLIVDEVYRLCGESQMILSKSDRLIAARQYLQLHVRETMEFRIQISQFYTSNKAALLELYEKIKSDNLQYLQELIFYPQTWGGPIYSYTILDTDLIDDVVEKAVFTMQKTTKPDVYNLLHTETKNKIDIAFIPDTATSQKCKSWYRKSTTEILVECRMDFTRDKWVPVNRVRQ